MIKILKSFSYARGFEDSVRFVVGQEVDDNAIETQLARGLENEGFIQFTQSTTDDSTTGDGEVTEIQDDSEDTETEDEDQAILEDEDITDGQEVDEYSKEAFLKKHKKELIAILEGVDEELTGEESHEELAEACAAIFAD
jgi:hypothetical protein